MPESDFVCVKFFEDLSLEELHACLKLRGEVFVVGQQICAVPDVDELDPRCHHALLWQGGELVGTARLLIDADQSKVKVGRVAVAMSQQGRGLGTILMQAVQAWIGQEPGRTGVMSAQAHLVAWYTRLGWLSEGPVYVEAGIDHQAMVFDPGASAAGN